MVGPIWDGLPSFGNGLNSLTLPYGHMVATDNECVVYERLAINGTRDFDGQIQKLHHLVGGTCYTDLQR